MDPKDRVELLALLEMQANAPRYGELRISRIKAVLDAGFSPAEAMKKARHGEALTEEEFVLANMGILPIEMKEIREARSRNEFPELEDCPPLKSYRVELAAAEAEHPGCFRCAPSGFENCHSSL